MTSKARQPVVVRCRCCGGSGQIELTGVHAETLELLRGQDSRLCGADLARLAGCTIEAMANRLTYLERLGLTSGDRFGRKRLWSVVVPAHPTSAVAEIAS